MSVKKTVIINRAVPGSGKTTFKNRITDYLLANSISVACHSTDDFFLKDGRYIFVPEKLNGFHIDNQHKFNLSLQQSVDVIFCDNTNLSPWQSKPYSDAARLFEYQIILITFHPRELWKHVESQKVTPQKPDAHQVPEWKLIEFIEEYHLYTPLLSRENPIDPAIHKNFRWDQDLLQAIALDEPTDYFDYDHLITIKPDDYKTLEPLIGERIHELIKHVS